MAVYKSGHQVDMFLGITFNNLMVAFRTYVFGIFLSIGSIAILLYNGIMVGCFQYFFIERGLFAESALTIWLHGTLEISSIILAGGAGLTLGSGLIFPGTYSRLQAFQISAMRSLKLMLGITPIFVFAAVIESFLTRYTEVPDIVRLFLIILSAVFIVGYFVVYPWYKSKTGFEYPLVEVKLPPNSREAVKYDRVKNNAEILKDGFVFFQKNANTLFPWIMIVTLLMTTARFMLIEETDYLPYMEWWQYLFNNLYFALGTPSPLFILINAAGISLIIVRVFSLIDNDSKKTAEKLFSWNQLRSLVQTMIIVAIVFAAFYYLEGWGSLLIMFSYAIFLLFVFAQHSEETNLLYGFARSMTLAGGSFGQLMGLQVILLLMSFSFLMILSAPLIYFYTEIFEWNFAQTDVWVKNIVRYIEIFIKMFAFNLILPLLAASVAYLYFNLTEIVTADHLKRSILLVGTKLSKNSKR
jgi:uncharacterized membrane protein SpoIIM required for sporulation